MNRCQHQEKISYFCITQTCISKECSGCLACMNKYHNHISKSKIMTQQHINTLVNKLNVPPQVKPKSKSYRQALLHYISHIKTQINICLDHTLRTMINQLNSPFIYQEGHQGTLKKFLNCDYRKINKKQLAKFISFIQDLSQQKIIQQERTLYEKEAQKIFEAITNLNKSMKLIKQSVKEYFQQLDCGDIFYNKLVKLNQIRKQISPSKKNRAQQEQATNNNHNILKVDVNQGGKRKRKVSIDHTFDFQPIKHHLTQYDKNQKEIQQKMNKLLGLMNKKQTNSSNLSSENDKSQLKNPQAVGLLSSVIEKEGKITDKMQSSIQSNQNNPIALFSAYLEKGINIPEIVERIVLGAHTTIPAPQNKQVLYQQTQSVKKKTIKVPMNAIAQQEESNSPILRKKKNANNNFLMALKKIGQQQQKSSQTIQQTSLEKKQETIQIADHEARSLALLMKSIHLSPKQAIPLLQKALQQSKDNLSAAQYLSYLYLQESRPKQCLNLCNQTLQKITHSGQYEELSVHLINNKAAALNSLGRYSQSISILQGLIKKNQKDVFYKNLGDAYFSIGIYEKSLSNYKRAVKMNPQFDQAHFNMSVCHFMLQHYNEAKIILEQVLKIDSNNPEYVQFNEVLNNKLKLCDIQ